MPAHSTLTGADLHEPKGVSGASANTAYWANGAGSGTWAKTTVDRVDATSIKNINKFKLTVQIDDVSTADFVLVPLPEACLFVKATMIIQNAITAANSIMTFTNSTGPTTIGNTTIAFAGSAEGTIFTFTPSSNNAFTAGTFLKIATDGGSSTAARMIIHLDFTLT